VYAAPHWLCGNFLFYRKGDLEIRDAATWSDLLSVLAKQKTSLVFDLYGRLTLGEWYITFLADRVGPTAAQAAILASAAPNDDVILDLRQLLTACPEGMCRSKPLHDRTGFYARAFVRGEAHGYIGYSESLHYGLQEAIDNCGPGTSCISPDEIAVRRLPSIKAGQAANGIGWVDGLAISAALPAFKKEAAQKFIAFATSAEGYNAVLQPLWMEAPRYLLPARTGLKFDDAPLYPAFLAAHAGRHTGTQPDLNKHLQDLSGNLNCVLPIDRTDTKSLNACKKTP
jgi:thiamine pyridinylase